jgi:hypothetical protein
MTIDFRRARCSSRAEAEVLSGHGKTASSKAAQNPTVGEEHFR